MAKETSPNNNKFEILEHKNEKEASSNNNNFEILEHKIAKETSPIPQINEVKKTQRIRLVDRLTRVPIPSYAHLNIHNFAKNDAVLLPSAEENPRLYTLGGILKHRNSLPVDAETGEILEEYARQIEREEKEKEKIKEIKEIKEIEKAPQKSEEMEPNDLLDDRKLELEESEIIESETTKKAFNTNISVQSTENSLLAFADIVVDDDTYAIFDYDNTTSEAEAYEEMSKLSKSNEPSKEHYATEYFDNRYQKDDYHYYDEEGDKEQEAFEKLYEMASRNEDDSDEDEIEETAIDEDIARHTQTDENITKHTQTDEDITKQTQNEGSRVMTKAEILRANILSRLVDSEDE